MSDGPRCPRCQEDQLIEPVPRPSWAAQDVEEWLCLICAKTWFVKKS